LSGSRLERLHSLRPVSASVPSSRVLDRELPTLSPFRPPAATNRFGSDGKRVAMSQLLKDDPSLPLPDSPLANADNAGTI